MLMSQVLGIIGLIVIVVGLIGTRVPGKWGERLTLFANTVATGSIYIGVIGLFVALTAGIITL